MQHFTSRYDTANRVINTAQGSTYLTLPFAALPIFCRQRRRNFVGRSSTRHCIKPFCFNYFLSESYFFFPFFPREHEQPNGRPSSIEVRPVAQSAMVGETRRRCARCTRSLSLFSSYRRCTMLNKTFFSNFLNKKEFIQAYPREPIVLLFTTRHN